MRERTKYYLLLKNIFPPLPSRLNKLLVKRIDPVLNGYCHLINFLKRPIFLHLLSSKNLIDHLIIGPLINLFAWDSLPLPTLNIIFVIDVVAFVVELHKPLSRDQNFSRHIIILLGYIFCSIIRHSIQDRFQQLVLTCASWSLSLMLSAYFLSACDEGVWFMWEREGKKKKENG